MLFVEPKSESQGNERGKLRLFRTLLGIPGVVDVLYGPEHTSQGTTQLFVITNDSRDYQRDSDIHDTINAMEAVDGLLLSEARCQLVPAGVLSVRSNGE